MTATVALTHSSVYEFDRMVDVFPHVVRLRPALHTRTPILSYSLEAEPEDHLVNWQQDPFGNFQARFVFPTPTQRLQFDVALVAQLVEVNPFDFFVEAHAQNFPFEYGPEDFKDLTPYLERVDKGVHLASWLTQVEGLQQPTVSFLADLTMRLRGDLGYETRYEPGVQAPEETLARRAGSCRDSTWLLIQILRHLGLAARFVSGYLVQLSDVSVPGATAPEHDFTDLHAWAEVYLPGAGWIGLDPTSGLFAGQGYIPLACTPEPRGAAAITGATGPCKVAFSYHHDVNRVQDGAANGTQL